MAPSNSTQIEHPLLMMALALAGGFTVGLVVSTASMIRVGLFLTQIEAFNLNSKKGNYFHVAS